MKKLYIQPISIFGLVIPIVALLITVIVISFAKSSVLRSFKASSAAYAGEKPLIAKVESLKRKVSNQGNELDEWKALSSGDNYQKIISKLGSTANDSPTKSMLITKQAKSSQLASTADQVDSPAEGMTLSIRGTFSELQQAFLDLEQQHPNLFASSLDLSPSNKVLELEANYIIWKSNN